MAEGLWSLAGPAPAAAVVAPAATAAPRVDNRAMYSHDAGRSSREGMSKVGNPTAVTCNRSGNQLHRDTGLEPQ